MNADTIRVLLVDDQELMRTGFALILSTEPEMTVVGEAGEGEAALRLIEELSAVDQAPHVVLMDVRMPGMNGIDATARIIERFPAVRIIVLTTFDLDEYAMDAIEAGASGFLLKDARAAELIAAVRAVAEGDAVMAPSVTRRLLSRLRAGDESARVGGAAAGLAGEPAADLAANPAATVEEAASSSLPAALAELTEREREVLELITAGLSNTEIGDRLYLSESTVKTHVGRILAKLGLRDRVHAVIFAYENGLRGA